jgi:hypothetical protein
MLYYMLQGFQVDLRLPTGKHSPIYVMLYDARLVGRIYVRVFVRARCKRGHVVVLKKPSAIAAMVPGTVWLQGTKVGPSNPSYIHLLQNCK